jgi:hypothetical protein
LLEHKGYIERDKSIGFFLSEPIKILAAVETSGLIDFVPVLVKQPFSL